MNWNEYSVVLNTWDAYIGWKRDEQSETDCLIYEKLFFIVFSFSLAEKMRHNGDDMHIWEDWEVDS